MKYQSTFLLIVLMITCTLAFGQRSKKKKGAAPQEPTEQQVDKSKFKAYSDVITDDALSDEGLFTVHQVDDKYYYEVRHDLLNRDMLWVTRFVNLPSGFGGGYVNAGSKTNEQVVRWERFQDQLLLRIQSFNAVANDSLPIYQSVQANNYQPILYAFPIKSFDGDSSASIIDVTDLFTSDVKALSGLSSNLRKSYKVKKLDGKRSFINSIKSFPLNIEVKQEMTYDADEPPSDDDSGTISLQMNQSMILLPEDPMQPRIHDPRVGWFTVSQIDYGSEALKADQKTFIQRWRLVPKNPAAYARGELVEPVKPIVYYLDPATPEKLRPYIKQGVEDWQGPFETAGFKNAIIAKYPPTPEEDPDFSPEDIRYSTVRYVASTTRNATGPRVADPRSGEIIESDIIWYHNHLRSYRNRYLLETGAANPSARTLDTPEEEIGEMMRMVIAHEIGHALGFPHNMRASFAYPVDSLRSGSFTRRFGIASTIMDYARYNYVAQPGDENIRFIRQLGPYDHYATNWGYRVIPEAASPEQEQQTLNGWILEKANDPTYWFGEQRNRFDPASQTECVGDDPMAASSFGISNLQYVAKHLPSWTSDQTNNYDDLEELYGELLGVWSRYLGHVVTNVGGIYELLRTPEQGGAVYEHVNEATQRSSMDWLNTNAFSSPDWLISPDILRNINHAGHFDRINNVQARHLNTLLSFETIGRLIDAETLSSDYYSALEMMTTLRRGVWSEARGSQKVGLIRRNLQRSYLERMSYLMTEEQRTIPARFRRFSARINFDVEESDVRALVRGELNQLRTQLRSARTRVSDTMTRYHYDDAMARIDEILEGEG
ncbi:MAG: zinc-dependent metalloprotease [Bacteroidota bacterium]